MKTFTLCARLGAAFALSALPAFPAELSWPEVTNQTKPWTRWWWLGNSVSGRDLSSEMQKYAAAGLGGLEITPIYGVRGEEKKFVPFLSGVWVAALDHVVKEGRRLDLGIDMATGTGWPFGGPWVGEEDAAKYLARRSFSVPAGGRLAEPVTFVQKPLLRVAGPRKVELAQLSDPIAANANLQDLAIDQVRFEKPLPLVALVAFSASGEWVDLTNKVGADGKLDWTAPAAGGVWTLHALFQGVHGKMVERAAPGGEGLALDHLSSASLGKYLKPFDEAFARRDLKGLRAFFNDSYEVDDSSGEADFTPRFLDEFKRRRGYDLRGQLPALFANDPGLDGTRVLSDYRETVSDLLLEEFTQTWRKWAARRGALIRNQAHGSPANILDLYAASDIPETEGNDVLRFKFASSAAHVTGKTLASAETGTWLDEHWLATLAAEKAAVDDFFLGGINHNCYHGTAFSPPDEPWPGYQFYASVELNPANPIWVDFPALNAYVTRAQSFLQAGRPDEDVLLYFNIHDRWAQRGTGAMPHFHGPDGSTSRDTGAALLASGVGFDFVSDRQLQTVRAAKGAIVSATGSWRAIVVPETTLMPVETLRALVELADRGATVIVQKALPFDVPGFGDLTARRKEFGKQIERARKGAELSAGIARTAIGKGQILVGPDLPRLLAQAGVKREALVDRGLRFVRRTDAAGQGSHYFLLNRGTSPVDAWVPLNASAAGAAIFDPMTGAFGRAAMRPKGEGIEVYLQLAPGESCIVQTSATAVAGPAWNYWKAAAPLKPNAAKWTVHFVAGGPQLPDPTSISELRSWTNFGGAAVKSFGGTAKYTQSFARPAGTPDGWLLDLGRVAESARVVLNGKELGTLIQAPYRLVLSAADLRDQNTLEVFVTNLGANRIADLDRRSVPWKKFYNTNMPARRPENRGPDGLFTAAKWLPRDSGLIGPVTWTPLQAIKP